MPERAFTVATYAAGASLAAITLIYVFGPTYFLDSQPSAGSGGPLNALANRKKGIVGLANAANDCFINSVLQALAGLGDLRLYLIRETHRRNIDAWVYTQLVPDDDATAADAGASASAPQPPSRRNPMPAWKVEGLQAGIVTKGLKEILDQLNERPIYKKTITAMPFVKVLELAFRQRISRQQQDAQEFLQVVAERLCDEYHAGLRARRHAKRTSHLVVAAAAAAAPAEPAQPVPAIQTTTDEADDEEDGFPMEGKTEYQVECLTCGFKPRPSEQAFCTMTLNVPQVASTSLSSCFDGMFKTEYIDDFKCEKCRLVHAKEVLEAELSRATSDKFRRGATEALAKLQAAIETDPEKPPEGVELPDARYAPKRRIARHNRVTLFPKILAIHLSRSIYDASQLSQKNSAKVTFPEMLPLGGLLSQRKYKLLGLVTHKGSHHSGHYESFRRQNIYPPYSNPSTFQVSGVYSRSASPAATPQIGATHQPGSSDSSPLASTPDLLSPSAKANGSTASLESTLPRSRSSVREQPSSSPQRGPTSAPREPARDRDAETSSIRSIARSTLSRISPSSRSASRSQSRNGAAFPGRRSTPDGAGPVEDGPLARQHTAEPPRLKRKKHYDRWWRISDDKIKEASTKDVLGMQREVYLLFYELERSS